jgi:hypothetical protein
VLDWLLEGTSTDKPTVSQILNVIIDLPVQIHEKNLQPINKEQQVHSQFLHDEKFIADRHMVLTLTPTLFSPTTLEALTLDASSMQYGYKVKSYKDFKYAAEREEPEQTTHEHFGSMYRI